MKAISLSVGHSHLSALRFGVFELDLGAGELRKNGILIRLPPQPFRVLALIASRHGQVVSREEIQREIWGNETFVDFEQGMNHCVRQIRNALGDNADAPRYLETLPRRGYRFIAPVEEVKIEEPSPANTEELLQSAVDSITGSAVETELPDSASRMRRRYVRRRTLIAAGSVILAAAVVCMFWLERRGSSARSAEGHPSIAVLPFADMSAEKNQEFFSDGLAEELLDALAKIPGLRVTGRVSAFQFKGKNDDIQIIGKKLNVATILEGSVRKQGDRVRIAVQLIKVEDGSLLWSDSFDREITDIFAVQEQIAQAVTKALRIKLLNQTEVAATTNAEAYNAYLIGRYFLARGNDTASLGKGVSYLEQALKLDPSYAPAWVWLGEARNAQAGSSYIPVQEGYRMAREAVERALVLDSNLADAYAVLGLTKMLGDWDWAGADQCYRRALELKPGDGGRLSVLLDIAALRRIQGRLDESIALHRRAMEIDPLRSTVYKNLGLALYYAGKQDEARAALNKALELNERVVFAHSFLAEIHLAESRPQDALNEAKKEEHPVYQLSRLALAYYALGQRDESNSTLTELVARFPTDAPYQIAEVYAFRGERDRALEWLWRAYAQRDPGLPELKVDPLLNNIKHDPRYIALLKKMHLT